MLLKRRRKRMKEDTAERGRYPLFVQAEAVFLIGAVYQVLDVPTDAAACKINC